MTAYRLLDPKIKKIVKDGFKNKKITERDDIRFDISKITDVEAASPTQADAPAEMELTGKVLEGKHHLDGPDR